MELIKSVLPRFSENLNVIACSSSIEYAPYLSVYLRSIKDNASSQKMYDIVVFESSFTKEMKEILASCFNSDNFSVRFVNPEEILGSVDLYITLPHFKRECYYRIVSPQILKNYNRILFTDIDLVATGDVAKIFDIPMNGNIIAACIEPIYKSFYDENKIVLGQNVREYTDNVLKIKPENYYNTGVLLIDVEKYIKNNVLQVLLGAISENYFLYQEQDALNCCLRDNIMKLSLEWNYEADMTIYNHPDIFDYYIQSLSKMKICHFLGGIKPWFYPEKKLAHIWWQYARKTPFYEEILARLIDFRITQRKNEFITPDITKLRQELANVHFPNINKHFAADEYQTKMLFVLNHLGRFKAKKAYFAVKKAFAFGEKHKKYQQKYDVVKQLIRDAKEFKKGLLKI